MPETVVMTNGTHPKPDKGPSAQKPAEAKQNEKVEARAQQPQQATKK